MISEYFNFESHKQTNDFYGLLASYLHRPCILQPSMVTSKSNTSIDNIFTNDVFCDILTKKHFKAEKRIKIDFKHFLTTLNYSLIITLTF